MIHSKDRCQLGRIGFWVYLYIFALWDMLSAATQRQLKSFDKEGLVEVGLNRQPAIWYYQNTSLTMRYDCDCNLNYFLQLPISEYPVKKVMSVQLFICCKMRSNIPTLSLKPAINVAIRPVQCAISLISVYDWLGQFGNYMQPDFDKTAINCNKLLINTYLFQSAETETFNYYICIQQPSSFTGI